MPSPRDDALAIWKAGLAAVEPTRLVRGAVRVENGAITVAGERIELPAGGRIAVVGAGKAGAGMAAGLEDALGPDLLRRTTGWVNVPADCVRPLKRVTLHPARPAGVNEPTAEGVRGTEEMLRIVAGLGPDDLCFVLISGGGSALLPGPASPVTLAEKQAITRSLSAAGATIQELNAVRKRLSTIKGGRLGAAITAGRTISLILSDVIGDPLDLIASGPTVTDAATADAAEAALRRHLSEDTVPASVWERLRATGPAPVVPASVRNVLLGSNRAAVLAAAAEARSRGYLVKDLGSENAGDAAAWGRTLAEAAIDAPNHMRRPLCLVAGGETTVNLGASDRPRKGGRNQEVALAAVLRLWHENTREIAVVSGGTDGEDGPTDAAGALADAGVIAEAKQKRLKPAEFLAEHDSYAFFAATNGLIKTGPTGTNVMDVQVVVTRPRPRRAWEPRLDRIAELEALRPRRPGVKRAGGPRGGARKPGGTGRPGRSG